MKTLSSMIMPIHWRDFALVLLMLSAGGQNLVCI